MASLVAVLTATTALVDWVSKTVDDPPRRPPPEIDARIVDVELRDRALPLGDYLAEIGEPALLRRLTEWERDEPGWAFLVRVRLRGGVGDSFPLVWTLHEASSGRRLRAATYNQTARTTFHPRSRNHSRTWPIWVPYPPREGRYRLRATLTDGEGQPVDEQESAAVALADSPR